MAKVPLRKYNSEIEALIERGQTDEAIAHCRHILKTFPKHLETYRLLGKAYLESKSHAEATDIFNRVLMAVPDDFVSHVGLSIIADEQKRLDDAIWHMERAFEKQPSNAAIQAELQRLYGRRDGREPAKIRLTRGALAHMYYQGELYTQAVSEVRSVLAEDPSRTDMQSLLALAYFRAGQKVEASETCSQLLSQFPYCLDANRALIEILPGTGMAENVGAYQQRVVELDPYAAYARGSIFQTDDAPDVSVSLERLDYKGQPVETGPDWGKSAAIGLGAAASPNAQPDWLKSSDYQAAPASPSSQAFGDIFDTPRATPEPVAPVPSDRGPFGESQPPAAPSAGEDIPEWMRQAGWGTSTGTFDESAVSTSAEESAEDELAKADLPDWIKSMAPKDTQPPPAAPAAPMDQETLDWLNKLSGDKPFGSASQSTPVGQDQPFGSAPSSETLQAETFADMPKAESSVPSANVPDWLTSLDQPAQEPASPAAVETHDWMSELGDAGRMTASAAAAETADWLSKLDEPTQESVPAAETADWLSKLDEPLDAAQEIPAVEAAAAAPASMDTGIGDLGTSVADQDAAMLWLESLAAKQGAKSEELITNPDDRLENAPEWVEQAKVASESQSAVPAPEAVSFDADDLSSWLSKLDEDVPFASALPSEISQDAPPEPPQDMQFVEPAASAPASLDATIGNLGTSTSDQDASMLWLESLAAKQGAKSEELITNPDDRLENAPEWVEQAKVASESQPVAQVPEEKAQESVMPEMPTIDQTGVWLRELDEKDSQPEKPVETEPAAWSGEIEIVPPPTGPLAESAPEADLPSWLRGIEAREAAPVVSPLEAMPDWLKGDEPEVPSMPEPTRPADWMPEAQKVAPPPTAPAPMPEPKPESGLEPRPEPRPEPRKAAVRKPKPEVAADRSKLKRTGMLPPLIDPNLAQARDALSHGKIPDALQTYGTLIRKGKLLEDITFDLKEALYRFPVEVSIWQALGDAYMRANRLQDALDAYTKAEELLR